MGNYSKKQITPLIEKYGIDVENDKVFNTIIDTFDGQTNYQIWAIKAVYGKATTFQNIMNLKQFVDENSKLISKLSKQNIVAYVSKSDFELLADEIEGLIKISLVKHCIEQFNTTQRNMLKKYVFGDSDDMSPAFAKRSSSFNKKYEMFSKFCTLSDSRKHKLIVSASAVNDDLSFLIKMIEDSFSESYVWEKQDLLGFIKRNPNCKGVKVVYDKDNIVILEIPTFDASKTICGNGRTTWCITRDNSYFNQYVGSKPENRQFFYFDFSKKEKDSLAHVGFTLSKKSIAYAHDTNNNSLVGSGITYNGKKTTINTILEDNKIGKNTFIHLNGLKGFEWTIESIYNFIDKVCKGASICCEIDGKIIMNINDKASFDAICGNMLVDSSRLDFKNGKVYSIFNTKLAPDSEKGMVVIQYTKDKYGCLSPSAIYDAYSDAIDKKEFFTKSGINQSMFLNAEKIDPSILLHKYIDEGDEKSAIKTITDNLDKIDVNYELEERSPIFVSIEKQMLGLFKEIVNNKKFNSNNANAYGEPLLHELVLDYRARIKEDKKNEKSCITRSMIEIILDSENYDFNAIDINLDTVVNIAAEQPSTIWILEALLKKESVDLNVINDYNCAAFGNAIRFNNKAAIEMIAHSPKLKVISADHELAKKYGVDIDSYLSKATSNSKTTEIEGGVSIDEYARMFASTFASTK